MMRRSYCPSRSSSVEIEGEEGGTDGKVKVLSSSYSSDFYELQFHIKIYRLGLQEVTMHPREDLPQWLDEGTYFDRSDRCGR